ncbi:MAG: SpoIIE family protein phosphatase [Phycisphaerales bacterium]|nr:SpoIIE family protein phosphatase [Phycisphaerales bacterium]
MAIPLAVVYVILNTMEGMELARTTLNEERKRAQLVVRLQSDEVSAHVRMATLRAHGILAMTSAVQQVDPARLKTYLRAAATPQWIAGIGLLDTRNTMNTTIVTGLDGAPAVVSSPGDNTVAAHLDTLLQHALTGPVDTWLTPKDTDGGITPIFITHADHEQVAVAIAVDARLLTAHVATEDEHADPWVVVNAGGDVVFGHPVDAIGRPVGELYRDVPVDEMTRIRADMDANQAGWLELDEPHYWVGWAPVQGSPWRLLLPIDMGMILTPVWSAVRNAAIIAAVGIVVNLLVIVLLAGVFTKPIRTLAAAFTRVREGALDTRVEVQSRDELGHLADGFNAMTAQLTDLIDEKSRAQVEQAAVERELAIAHEMQASLLPPSDQLPNCATGRVLALTQPAKQVGGDFFDAWERDGSVWFTVADVSGKGVGAGLFMAVASTILHGVRKHADNPGTALNMLNDRLLEDGTDRPVFLTMFLGRLDPDGRLTFASAGHPPVIRIGSEGVAIDAGATGPPLAMARDMTWTTETLHLEPGERVLVYSDGASEAHDINGDMLDTEGLATMVLDYLKGDAPDAELYALATALTDMQPEGQFDDITLLCLHRPQSDSPA